MLINESTNSPCRVSICIVSVYLFTYLSIYLSTYLFLDMYASISFSLYMTIIKQYCFQIEQLKLWQKQNILYFENDVILWLKFIFLSLHKLLYKLVYKLLDIYDRCYTNFYWRYTLSLTVEFCQEVRTNIRKK